MASSHLQEKLKMILEGTYESEPLNEAVAEIAAIAVIATAMGVSIAAKRRDRKAQKEKERVASLEREEKKKRWDAFVAKNPVDKLVASVKADVKKAVTAMKSNAQVKAKIESILDGEKYELQYHEGEIEEFLRGDGAEYRIDIFNTKVTTHEGLMELYPIIRDIEDVLKEKYAEAMSLGVIQFDYNGNQPGGFVIAA